MAKLPRVTARDIISVLERKGFVFARQDGSHKIYKNLEGGRVTVPYHGAKILHPKILKSIIKDADIFPDQLRNML